MGKVVDLQPWLEYFGMLQKYEQKGFLQMEPDKHEAYVTEPALCSLSSFSDNPEDNVAMRRQLAVCIRETVMHIRTYAGWMAQQGESYLRQNFAVHVVADTIPHDLLYTLFISRRRWPLHRKDRIEVIDYRQP